MISALTGVGGCADAGAGERQDVPPQVEQPPAEPEPAVHDHLLVVSTGRCDALLPRRDPQGAQTGALSMQSVFRTNIQVSSIYKNSGGTSHTRKVFNYTLFVSLI